MDTAEAIIIGAGVNGTSTAFHLAKSGMKHIIVVEKSFLGGGATGKSGALVRTNYPNEAETRIALESLAYFKNWNALVGGDCGYQAKGLLCFTPPEHREQLEAQVTLHRQLGVNTHLLPPKEAKKLDPSLFIDDVDDVTAVLYEPEAGFADPNATTYAFAHAAMRLGTEFRLEMPATRLLIKGERVVGVETTKGPLFAPIVVVIAGAWANHLLEPLGVDLGLQPKRARVCVFRWAEQRSPHHLTYLDRINHLWARPIDGNCTLVGVDREQLPPGDPDHYSEGVEQDYIDLCREQLAKRFPVMRQGALRGSWACMLMFSPDSHPIVGQLPPYEGLYCIAGDSGTAFKLAPGLGKCLAELIVEGKSTTVDLTPFRPTRFSEGKPWNDDFSFGGHQRTISR